MLSFILFSFACGPKEVVPQAPIVGWHQEESWAHACYHPPEFEKQLPLDRQVSREKTLEDILLQWKGEKGGSISIEEKILGDVEDTILGEMPKVESVSRENLAKCKQAATGQLSAGEWKSWIIQLPKTLTVGECKIHFLNTVLDWLEIDIPWMPTEPLPICRGDQIVISGSVSDKYRIEDGGPWITILGDPNKPTDGSELPCREEGCFAGMMLLRFVSVDGDEEIHPVGKRMEFTAPADGHVTYGINDDSWFDNKWYVADGLQHHASITVAPAK